MSVRQDESGQEEEPGDRRTARAQKVAPEVGITEKQRRKMKEQNMRGEKKTQTTQCGKRFATWSNFDWNIRTNFQISDSRFGWVHQRSPLAGSIGSTGSAGATDSRGEILCLRASSCNWPLPASRYSA